MGVLTTIVTAVLMALHPGGDMDRVPAGARQDMGVPKRAVCRMVVDDTSHIVCAWRTRGGDVRVKVASS